MSYILDALKKSEQQRQRGATPTLPAAQATAGARRPSMHIFLGVFAFALLGAGIVIGWLRPGLGDTAQGQGEQTVPATEPVVVKPSISIAQLDSPTPLPVPAGMTKKAVPVPAPSQGMHAAPGAETAGQDTSSPAGIVVSNMAAPAPSPSAEKPAAAQERNVMTMAELPMQIQQEIPALAVQLHAYSTIRSERVATINFHSLREGDFLTPDLRLEQITPDGLILNYKGYRFQRGIR